LKGKKMKKIAILSIFVLLMGFGASAQAATYIPVASYSDFTALFPSPLVENFEDATLLPGLKITEVGYPGVIQNGVYQNIVDDATVPPSYQTFGYASGMKAFGAWLDLANPGGPGSSIDIYADGVFVMNVPNTAAGQFYGFYSPDAIFTKVAFLDAGTILGAQETYQAVDLALVPAPVPIPGAAYLLGSGLLGLLGLRRRKSVA